MAFYDFVFDKLGLSDWCNAGGGAENAPTSMAALLAQSGVVEEKSASTHAGQSFSLAMSPSG